MNYANVREIRMIDMMKPAEESPADFSRESIHRRIKWGKNAMKVAADPDNVA